MESRRGRDRRVGQKPTDVAVAGRRVPAAPDRSLLSFADQPRFAWSTEDATVVTGGAALTLVAHGPDRFEAVKGDARRLFESLERPDDLAEVARPRLFGGFAFHEAHGMPADGPWQGFPGALFVLPAIQLTRTAAGTWLTTAAAGSDRHDVAADRLERWTERLAALPAQSPSGPPGIRRRRPRPDRSGWRDQVETALASIDGGALDKVVLAQSLSVDLDGDLRVPDALARLAQTYPDCTRFLVDPSGAGSFFGATPERLVRLSGRDVDTTVLAGSTGRGETSDEDDWLATELTRSDKDLHEHEVVLDAVRDQLAPMTESITTADRRVRTLATVQHLETPVSATLDRDRHVLDLVEALHPTPAVGGMPQDAALRAIREHEGFDRGWYAAPVGWIDADGDGGFSVALRSAVARGNRATLFAGAGIVADSEPDREWSELQLKYRPVLDVLE